jgi:hypothetical protein
MPRRKIARALGVSRLGNGSDDLLRALGQRIRAGRVCSAHFTDPTVNRSIVVVKRVALVVH